MLNIVRAYMFNSYVCMPTFYVSIHKKLWLQKWIYRSTSLRRAIINYSYWIGISLFISHDSLWTINVEILTKLIELCWKIFMSTVIFLRHSLTSGPLQILRSREYDDNCHVPQCNKTWCCSVRAFTIAQTWMYLEWL